ncbi:MAG: hypothetical protein Fur0042_14030 [Cyanophyceae cyanobacterium]
MAAGVWAWAKIRCIAAIAWGNAPPSIGDMGGHRGGPPGSPFPVLGPNLPVASVKANGSGMATYGSDGGNGSNRTPQPHTLMGARRQEWSKRSRQDHPWQRGKAAIANSPSHGPSPRA